MDSVSHDEHQALAARVDKLEQHMKTNMAKIDRIERNTKDIVDTFAALSGGFKVLQGIGRFAKPVGYIAAALTGCLAMWHSVKDLFR